MGAELKCLSPVTAASAVCAKPSLQHLISIYKCGNVHWVQNLLTVVQDMDLSCLSTICICTQPCGAAKSSLGWEVGYPRMNQVSKGQSLRIQSKEEGAGVSGTQQKGKESSRYR